MNQWIIYSLIFISFLGVAPTALSIESTNKFENQNSLDQKYVRLRLIKEAREIPENLISMLKPIRSNLWSLNANSSNKVIYFNNQVLAENNFIQKKTNGNYDVVALVDFENYLTGVVAHEMSEKWPIEALKAQAIVARTYAAFQIKQRKNQFYQLDADQMDQVFQWSRSLKVRQAVIETKEIVLTDKKGQLIKAFYHSECGGQTIPASGVWEGAQNTGIIKDSWCGLRYRNSERKKWIFEISFKEFLEKLNISQTENIKKLNLIANKIQDFQIGNKIFSVQKLRQTFGFSAIKNSPETIEIVNQKIRFTGVGFGHGVGLCQWGAKAQALAGRSAEQIVQFYYPQAMMSQKALKLSNLDKSIKLQENLNLPNSVVSRMNAADENQMN